MKELLGLVGFGPEEKEAEAKSAERPAPAPQPVQQERPAAQQPVAAPELPQIEREPAVERPAPVQPKIEREPAVERPVAQPKVERPVAQPKVEQPVAQQPAAQPRVEQPAAQQPVAQPKAEQPKAAERVEGAKDTFKFLGRGEEPTDTEMEAARRKAASAVERGGFFSFGRKAKEPAAPVRQEPVEAPARPAYTPPVEQPYTPPVQAAPVQSAPVQPTPVEEETIRPPFIRPGATVIAAGATFFGDIRAEGDVEVLGKVKGNLEATGNIRVTGKVLGDVKGEAVKLEGCTVQGNITSTSFVSLDAGAMVVGDVLATDFQSNGKIKGNLQIARAASFASCALLAGNVIAATIMMSQGARVQGAVRIAEDPETNSLFGELEI